MDKPNLHRNSNFVTWLEAYTSMYVVKYYARL